MVKKYIDYNKKTERFFSTNGARPDNQREAISKIITRLNRLRDLPGVELEEVQHKL
jgi:hypothetical protein